MKSLLAALALLIGLPLVCQASSTPADRPTLERMEAVANGLCRSPETYGYTRDLHGNIGGGLDISKLVRSLGGGNLSAALGGWSHKIGAELASDLTEAGASVVFNPTNYRSPAPPGVIVAYSHSNARAVALFQALQQSGINPTDAGQAFAPYDVAIEIGDPD